MKRKGLFIGIIAALTFGSLVVAGCGSNYSAKDSYSTGGYAASADNGYYEESYDSVSVATSTESQAESVNESSAEKRKRIISVNINAETKTFDETLVSIESKVSELGGYIESIDTNNGSYDYSYSYSTTKTSDMRIRIPAERLEGFLECVNSSCNVTKYSKSEEDVTLTYVDLQSHINALRTEQERLNELLAGADTIEDMIYIEERMANVRYELESYASQLRTFDNKIDYSTVSLYLREVQELTPVEEETIWQRISTGFAKNLTGVGTGLVNFFVWIIVSSPVFLLLGAIGVGVWLIVRANIRKNRKKRALEAAKKAEAETESKKVAEETESKQ